MGRYNETTTKSDNSRPDFFDRIQLVTEAYLSKRKRRLRVKKEKQKKKHAALDWLGSFFWAAGMVLLINQYLFQAYQIPSGSMINTLLIGDRIFVNKFIYGPELLPGVGKLPSPVKPKRNDIIIFENPAYISRGTAFNIAQRIIFMLTLSFIDIDRDEFGNPRPQFLIKRAVGVGGDRFVSDRGDLRIRPAGEDRWVDERTFNASRNMEHNLSRLVSEADYTALEAAGIVAAHDELALPVPPALVSLASPARFVQLVDPIAFHKARLELVRSAFPHESRYSTSLARYNLGWYVPESRLLPLGDNRDNSLDGRRFGPVLRSKVLGKAAIIFFPGNLRDGNVWLNFSALDRFGGIK